MGSEARKQTGDEESQQGGADMNRQSDIEERSRHPADGSEHFETVIIGGGQAGLSVGYHLSR
jgi:hypothetical protein